jgi:hypothetical protein
VRLVEKDMTGADAVSATSPHLGVTLPA